MTDQQKVDLYMKLFEEYLKRFDLRRQYEWKFNLALWGVILAFSGLCLKENINIGDNKLLLLISECLVFLIYVFIWTACLHRSNRYDRDYGFEYKKAIEKYANGTTQHIVPVTEPSTHYWKSLFTWSPLAQVMITGLLLFLAWLAAITV